MYIELIKWTIKSQSFNVSPRARVKKVHFIPIDKLWDQKMNVFFTLCNISVLTQKLQREDIAGARTN